MYSSSAVVTASFLVLWPPVRRASSIRLSSIARLVAMCRFLHIDVCGTRLSTNSECSIQENAEDENRGRFPVPGVLTAPALLAKTLLRQLLHVLPFHGFP